MKNKRHALLFVLVILFATALACSGSDTYESSSSSSGPERGWLCDYDKTGSIRLWSSASMNATVNYTVGTCTACCVDVTMHEEKTVDGILFYKIRVGGQSGWVDVDYYYPDWKGKPDWSSN